MSPPDDTYSVKMTLIKQRIPAMRVIREALGCSLPGAKKLADQEFVWLGRDIQPIDFVKYLDEDAYTLLIATNDRGGMEFPLFFSSHTNWAYEYRRLHETISSWQDHQSREMWRLVEHQMERAENLFRATTRKYKGKPIQVFRMKAPLYQLED